MQITHGRVAGASFPRMRVHHRHGELQAYEMAKKANTPVASLAQPAAGISMHGATGIMRLRIGCHVIANQAGQRTLYWV
jgi:hypothetical protein